MSSKDVLENESSRAPQRIRLPLQFRKIQVKSTERLGSNFIRLIFAGAELEGFSSPGFDDHIKLFFPDAGSGEIRLPTVGPNGPVWPEGPKPVMRDYTPRYFHSDTQTLAIDFALHEAGPATAWALAAQPGDWLGIGGPRGSSIISSDFDFHLLVGDETAVPAICRRLEELPSTARAIALIEVDNPGDEISLSSSAQLELIWCYRKGVAAGTSTILKDTLANLQLPEGEGYTWIACETKMARAMRSHLVKERNMNSKWIKAAGYWQLGAAGADSAED